MCKPWCLPRENRMCRVCVSGVGTTHTRAHIPLSHWLGAACRVERGCPVFPADVNLRNESVLGSSSCCFQGRWKPLLSPRGTVGAAPSRPACARTRWGWPFQLSLTGQGRGFLCFGVRLGGCGPGLRVSILAGSLRSLLRNQQDGTPAAPRE